MLSHSRRYNLGYHADTTDLLLIAPGSHPSELILTGDFTISTSPLVRTAITELRQHSSDTVVVDLAGVSFMDSRGLGTLLGARQDGGLTLARPSSYVRRLLEVTGLLAEFSVDA
jgi:anti-anti-sigma factor